MNGDASASGAHFDGVTWNADKLVAVFDRSVSGKVRVTGLLYYSPSGATVLS